jgi:hypothetical protein
MASFEYLGNRPVTAINQQRTTHASNWPARGERTSHKLPHSHGNRADDWMLLAQSFSGRSASLRILRIRTKWEGMMVRSSWEPAQSRPLTDPKLTRRPAVSRLELSVKVGRT